MDLSEAISFLHAAGRRITPERKLLLRIIGENAHLDAGEIYRLAHNKEPKISLSTVYQTTRQSKKLGVVEASTRGEDRHHYEVRLQEHYHLICLRRGKVSEISSLNSIMLFLVEGNGLPEEVAY